MNWKRPSHQQQWPTVGSAYDLAVKPGDYLVSDWGDSNTRVLVMQSNIENEHGFVWTRLELVEAVSDIKRTVVAWVEYWEQKPEDHKPDGAHEALADVLRTIGDDERCPPDENGYWCMMGKNSDGTVARGPEGLPQLCEIKYRPDEEEEMSWPVS